MSGRGYSVMPVGEHRGRPLAEVPAGYIRGFLAPGPSRRNDLSRLLRSLEIELARRRREARP